MLGRRLFSRGQRTVIRGQRLVTRGHRPVTHGQEIGHTWTETGHTWTEIGHAWTEIGHTHNTQQIPCLARSVLLTPKVYKGSTKGYWQPYLCLADGLLCWSRPLPKPSHLVSASAKLKFSKLTSKAYPNKVEKRAFQCFTTSARNTPDVYKPMNRALSNLHAFHTFQLALHTPHAPSSPPCAMYQGGYFKRHTTRSKQ